MFARQPLSTGLNSFHGGQTVGLEIERAAGFSREQPGSAFKWLLWFEGGTLGREVEILPGPRAQEVLNGDNRQWFHEGITWARTQK